LVKQVYRGDNRPAHEQSPLNFDLSPAKIADLRKHRVGDKILNAMKAASGDDSNSSKQGPPPMARQDQSSRPDSTAINFADVGSHRFILCGFICTHS